MVATPLLTPLVFLLMNAVYNAFIGHATGRDATTTLSAFTYAFGVPVAAVAMLAFGWPWIAWLTHRGRLDVAHVCAGASVIGAIALVVFARAMVHGDHFTNGVARFALVGLIVGALSGVLFCVIGGVPTRPAPPAVAETA